MFGGLCRWSGSTLSRALVVPRGRASHCFHLSLAAQPLRLSRSVRRGAKHTASTYTQLGTRRTTPYTTFGVSLGSLASTVRCSPVHGRRTTAVETGGGFASDTPSWRRRKPLRGKAHRARYMYTRSRVCSVSDFSRPRVHRFCTQLTTRATQLTRLNVDSRLYATALAGLVLLPVTAGARLPSHGVSPSTPPVHSGMTAPEPHRRPRTSAEAQDGCRCIAGSERHRGDRRLAGVVGRLRRLRTTERG